MLFCMRPLFFACFPIEGRGSKTNHIVFSLFSKVPEAEVDIPKGNIVGGKDVNEILYGVVIPIGFCLVHP